jgi:hypothetical protein
MNSKRWGATEMRVLIGLLMLCALVYVLGHFGAMGCH